MLATELKSVLIMSRMIKEEEDCGNVSRSPNLSLYSLGPNLIKEKALKTIKYAPFNLRRQDWLRTLNRHEHRFGSRELI